MASCKFDILNTLVCGPDAVHLQKTSRIFFEP